eukprot:SRR837773.17780.p1 GENE.SRR837773.17780~~SRR837773.17780.p1  ORF type:complete len:184 (+),score=43.54 SRR837773.17780:77-553(+)
MERRCDPSTTNEEGNTAVAIAAQYGHLKVTSVLLDHGAEASHANKKEQTPLFFARTAECISLLMERRCDPAARDLAGQTALFLGRGPRAAEGRGRPPQGAGSSTVRFSFSRCPAAPRQHGSDEGDEGHEGNEGHEERPELDQGRPRRSSLRGHGSEEK